MISRKKKKIITIYIFNFKLQAKVEQYKEQSHAMESRLSEVNQLANQSQIQLNETTHVINSLEDRQKITEVIYYM